MNTGTAGRLHRQQRVGERGIGRVGAVAHDDEAGERQPGELLAGAVERCADARLRAGERQVGWGTDPRRGRREPEGADHEALGQRLEDGRLRGRELLPDEVARGAWFQSAICMLRESSIRTPRKFC